MVLLSKSKIAIALGLSFLTIIGYILTHPIPIVLMLHSVLDDPQNSPHISSIRFQAFVKTIRQRSDPIEITTDSSEYNIYSNFYPALREHGLTATIFVLPLMLESEGMLTWSQIREMDRSGFTIGSHTLTHPWLPDLTDEEITYELCFSKFLIEKELGHSVTALAYPYGAFDMRVKNIAHKCGYTQAYVTAPGRRFRDNDSLAQKRVYVNEALLRNPVLTWLALSGFYVTTRELTLSLLPIDVPRKPEEWSYATWRKYEGGIEHQNLFCSPRSQPEKMTH